VSNLTNLLALQREQLSTLQFATRMALPELVAVVLTVAYLRFLYRRDLTGGYEVPDSAAPKDRWTFWVCAIGCVALAPGVLAGAPPWAVALPCAAAAVAVFAVRRVGVLGLSLLPWRIVVLTEGLFLVVTAIARHGATALLAQGVDESTLRTAAVAAATSNLVNNLPAYLAVEPAVPVGHTTQLLGTLLGTNCGPLVLLWGSLATLLWRERCRARGITVSARHFAAVGLAGVPLVLAGTWAALMATS
jgi:arsenical pump membrane protein